MLVEVDAGRCTAHASEIVLKILSSLRLHRHVAETAIIDVMTFVTVVVIRNGPMRFGKNSYDMERAVATENMFQ